MQEGKCSGEYDWGFWWSWQDLLLHLATCFTAPSVTKQAALQLPWKGILNETEQ